MNLPFFVKTILRSRSSLVFKGIPALVKQSQKDFKFVYNFSSSQPQGGEQETHDDFKPKTKTTVTQENANQLIDQVLKEIWFYNNGYISLRFFYLFLKYHTLYSG